MKKVGRLHVITDVVVQSRFSHADIARLAVEGGADCVQFRDKMLRGEEFLAAARSVLAVTRGRVPLVVNDDIDTAVRIGADGVHVGQTDASIESARAAMGEDAVVGASTGTFEQAVAAAEAGADYIGFGHVFPTGSKSKPRGPVGLRALAEVCASVPVPVIAIGGIADANVDEVFDAGAYGVAVIGAVCAASDPRAATAALAETIASRRAE